MLWQNNGFTIQHIFCSIKLNKTNMKSKNPMLEKYNAEKNLFTNVYK